MRHHKLSLWLVAALCLSPGCRHQPQPAPADPLHPDNEVWLSPAQVASAKLTLALAKYEAVDAPVVCAGKIAFDDERVAHVFAPVSGRITQIHSPVGAHVRAQGPLCSIQSTELTQAVAAERGAKADLTTAKRALDRERMLYEGHAAAQKDFEAARSAYVQAQAEYQRSHQKRVLLGGNDDGTSDSYLLRSPLEGNVVASVAHPGAEVQGQYDAGANVAELFVVGNLETVWALADVFEMDMHQVEVGDKVLVDVVAYPGEVFAAKVDWVSDAVDPNTRSVRVRCRLANPDRRLKPDMFVRMRILADKPAQVTIPRRALFRFGGQTVVFVAAAEPAPGGAQRFVRRPVQAEEAAYGDTVPVLMGLREGERVVSEGGIFLLGQ